MKIAIPTRNGLIDDHFGHCDHYTILTVENQQIIAQSDLPSPQGCGCKSGIADELAQLGVTVMLAGNMGMGAKNKLEAAGIKVIRGCHGPVETVAKGYLSGFILDSGLSCDAHGHECGHSHHD